MASVEADGFTEALEAQSKELAMEAARRWHSYTNEHFIQAGDELGYDVFPIVQSSLPPQWNPRDQAAEMSWPHRATPFINFGTTKHEIEGDPILVFEWEEMRGEEFADTGKTFEEVFDTFPTVFFPKVEVEGIERTNSIENGRRRTARWLSEQEG